jgi:hypothetical protein
MDRSLFAQTAHSLLCGLRSLRSFSPAPVPESALDDILTVARWTGSAKNLQPWQVVVVRDPAKLDALAQLDGYVEHVNTAPLGLVLVMDQSNPEFADFDEGRLAERITIAAALHGLGSVTAWWAGSGRIEAARLLNAPENTTVRTIISIGYPAEGKSAFNQLADPAGPTSARKDLADIVRYEQF